MFTTIQALSQTLNESTVTKTIETYTFFGGLSESFNEFNQMIAESAWDSIGDEALGNTIMVEAFVNGVPDEKLQIVQESIFGNAVSKVKEFFAKMVAYVKGIIEKLKTYIAGMNKKTDSWYSEMKPRIDKVLSNKSKFSKTFEYEAYQWNDGELSALSNKANAIASMNVSVKFAKTEVTASGVELKVAIKTDTKTCSFAKMDEAMKTVIDNVEGSIKSIESETGGADIVKYVPDSTSQANLDAMKKENKKAVDETLKNELNKILGNTGDISKAKEGLIKNIRGAKRGVKGLDNVETMLAYVKDCSEKLKTLAEGYNEVKEMLGNVVKELDGLKLDDGELSDDKQVAARSAAIRIVKEGYMDMTSTLKSIASVCQSQYNNITSLHSSLIQERAKEYMSILNKVAQLKA